MSESRPYGSPGEAWKPDSIMSVLGDVMGKDGLGKSPTNQARQVWSKAVGAFEESHTIFVYVVEPKVEGGAPSLVVYLDSEGVIQDFTTNKTLYLQRLDCLGFHVTDIKFKLSRVTKQQLKDNEVDIPHLEVPQRVEYEPLSAEEEGAIEQMCSGVDEKIKSTVINTMRVLYQREKKETTS